MNNIFRNSMVLFVFGLLMASSSFAAAAPTEEGGSLLLTLFIGFFALIVVFQLVPACLLFVGIVKGLFVRKPEAKAEVSNR